VADWTVQLNQNKLNRYASSGNLNYGEISDLLGEDLPFQDLKRPYSKVKGLQNNYSRPQKYYNQQRNSKRSFRNVNRSQFNTNRPGKKFGNRFRMMMYRYRNKLRSGGSISEVKIFSNFISVNSSWNSLYEFKKTEMVSPKPAEITLEPM
ncbi:MAG: hypothetical protein MHPSP_003747, partial [Paramarteilia canceri]